MNLFFSLLAMSPMEKTFTEIYRVWPWTEEGFLLSGSRIEVTKNYVDFLQEFLKKNNIRSVLDIGCGDWAFSRYVDWSGIEYTGIDIVEMVIEKNEHLFSSPNIRFIHGNTLEMDLPDADLILCKDVFQHLCNEDILQLLEKFKKYPHCLITNYVNVKSLSKNNQDISTGGYHNIDLRGAPFNTPGEKVLEFHTDGPKETIYLKN